MPVFSLGPHIPEHIETSSTWQAKLRTGWKRQTEPRRTSNSTVGWKETSVHLPSARVEENCRALEYWNLSQVVIRTMFHPEKEPEAIYPLGRGQAIKHRHPSLPLITLKPNSSGLLSGRGTLRNASISPTAGIKSGTKHRRDVSRSTSWAL